MNGKNCAFVLTAIVFLVPSFGSAQDAAQNFIAKTELLPRMERIQRYESALFQRRIDATSRLAITKAFANHAVKLSPLYTSSKWNAKRWIEELGAAWKADPNDLTVSIAYCQLLLDSGERQHLRSVSKQVKETHPASHEASAFAAFATGKLEREPLDFPLHFCILTKNPMANRKATEAQCKREVKILNETFRSYKGKPLVNFTFKSFTPYSDIAASTDEFVQYGDSTATYDSNAVAESFNRCDDSKIRDRGAINVYVFDAHSRSGGFDDATSHGKRNSNRPYILLDYARLNNSMQNAEAHEMGHAFGLGHVGVPGAKLNTSTNIMTSAAENFGSGGKRDIGFTPAQSAIILYHAARTHSRLGLD